MQVIDYVRETVNCLIHIAQSVFEYIDNNHPPLTSIQIEELNEFSDQFNSFYKDVLEILSQNVFENMDKLASQQQELIDLITKMNKRQLKRIKNQENGTKNSTLYINILSESKSLLLHTLHLLKAQKAFIQYSIKNGILGDAVK